MSEIKPFVKKDERPEKLRIRKMAKEAKEILKMIKFDYHIQSSQYAYYNFKTGKIRKGPSNHRTNLYANDEIVIYELKVLNEETTRFEFVKHCLKVSCMKDKIGEKEVKNEAGEVIRTVDVYGDDFIDCSLSKESGKYSRFIDLETGQDYWYSYITKRKLKTETKFSHWHHTEFYVSDEFKKTKLYQHSSFDKVLAYIDSSKIGDGYRSTSNLTLFCEYFKYKNKYPEIDNIIQKGLNMGYDMISSNANLYDYFFKGSSFKQNFILPKDCLNFITDKTTCFHNSLMQIIGHLNEIQFKNKDVTLEVLKEIHEIAPFNTYGVVNFFRNLSLIVVNHNIPVKQCISYLKRVDEYQAFKPIDSISQWVDYLEAIKSLNIENFDKYPNSLKREHDVYCREAGNFKNAANLEQFRKTMDNFKDIEFKNSDYVVVVPKEAQELIKEGSVLNHCVGSYVNRVVDRHCTIFFIRDVATPDKPLYTLEVLKGCRKGQLNGHSNRGASKEAHAFANEFIKKCLTQNGLETKVGRLEALQANEAV